MDKKPVLVTTEFRGVFFGYLVDDSEAPAKIVLENARNCVKWSDTRGVLGLAATGPVKNCRIGPKVPLFTAWKITSITECTPEAAERWEEGQWS